MQMNAYICRRVKILAEYIVENKATVRDAAARFGVSKSTVHKDVTERLMYVNSALHGAVKAVLENNKEERHIRGGMATREKYLRNKTAKNGNTKNR